jgi:hypothetical protein
MGYRMMGRGHAALVLMGARLRSQAGQGTVEYVALILLVAGLFAAVVAVTTKNSDGKNIAAKITAEINAAIDKVIKSDK